MGGAAFGLGAVAESDTAPVYVQLGAALFVLGLAARVAGRAGLSPIPLYLLAGLVLGSFDIPALDGEFIRFAAGLGVILLLFVIGLEYTAEELTGHLRRFHRAGAVDAALNFPPGFLFGLLLGWDPVAAILLGGITWVSSSGIVAKALSDLGWLVNRETHAILSVLVIEDLAMAGFLPLVASLLVGGTLLASIGSLTIAATAAMAALVGAIRFGEALGRIVAHRSEEVVLLSAMGLVLVASGVAEELQVSAAVGAFLVGIALSGEVAHRTRGLLSPIRDVNAALFFLFFALQIDTGAAGARPRDAHGGDEGARGMAGRRDGRRRRGWAGARRHGAHRARRVLDRPGRARRRREDRAGARPAGRLLRPDPRDRRAAPHALLRRDRRARGAAAAGPARARPEAGPHGAGQPDSASMSSFLVIDERPGISTSWARS
jgi:CPA2 family monovalent cation:H+ antiporter-2